LGEEMIATKNDVYQCGGCDDLCNLKTGSGSPAPRLCMKDKRENAKWRQI